MSVGLQTEPASSIDTSAAFCPNCDEALIGEHCHRCGEKRVDRGQLSLKHFIGTSVRELIDIEHSKIWATFSALISKPGFLTNEYFAGRKSRYLSPLKVCLIVFGLSLFLYSIYKPVAVYDLQTLIETDQTRATERGLDRLAERKGVTREVLTEKTSERWQTYMSWFQITNVIFLAILLKLVYLFSARYFVEHLIFSLHYLSFSFLSSVILWPVYLFIGIRLSVAFHVMTAFGVLVGIVYLFLALRAVYKQSLMLTALKTIAVFIGSYIILSLIMYGTLAVALINVMLAS